MGRNGEHGGCCMLGDVACGGVVHWGMLHGGVAWGWYTEVVVVHGWGYGMGVVMHKRVHKRMVHEGMVHGGVLHGGVCCMGDVARGGWCTEVFYFCSGR